MTTQAREATTEKGQDRKDAPEKPQRFFSKEVAEQLAKQLREGHAPMQRQGVQDIPYNPTTGRSFHGINSLNLMMQGHRDDRWMEFNDARNAGYKVKSGEKGTAIQYWLPKEPGQDKQKMQISHAYNAEQLEFIPPKAVKPVRPDPYDRVAEMLKESGVTVIRDQKERAFYNAAKDEIHLPKQDTPTILQDTLHAYFKSTGHPSRLNRESFNSPVQYKQNAEELICSVATMTMCAQLGVQNDYTKNAELTQKWADNIEKYPVQFSQAMQQADKAVFTTLLHEQQRSAELNPQENEAWRPVAEASPAIAVKTLLAQKEVLALASAEPEKLYAFQQGGNDVFTKPGTGYTVSKALADTPGNDGNTFRMKVRTEGYDRAGNTYNVTMSATVRQNESGLVEPLEPPMADRIELSTRQKSLPLDWNGKVEVAPCHEDEKGDLVAGHSEDFPDFHGAFAARDNGESVFLAAFEREKQAQYYANLVERQMEYQQERPQSQQRQTAGERDTANSQTNAQQRENPADREQPQHQEQTETREAAQEQPERTETEEQKAQQENGDEIRAQQEPEPDREQLRQDAKEKIAERLTKEKMDADKAANRVKAMIAKTFSKPNEPTPYMQNKGVDLIPGTYQNKGSTCIPLYNVDGELRSMAYADKDGKKNYAKGTDKSGCAFYDKKAVEKSNVVGFSVGVATAATISQTIKGVPVVATMDSANLPVVVVAFKEKYPDKQQVIFANNNLAYEAEKGRNHGKFHAEQAAKKTGALVVSPRFAANEKSKDFVDFNDLAQKSKYGKEAVKEQCESAVEKAKQMAAEKAREQKNEKERSNKELARG